MCNYKIALVSQAQGRGRNFLGKASGALAVALLLGAGTSSNAQFSYFQNFDSMGPSGTTLPILWSAGYLGTVGTVNRAVMSPYAGNGLSITPMTPVVSDGSALPAGNVGTVLNLGAAGGLDRALGNYPRTSPSGDQIMQVAIRNFTGAPLQAIQLSYWGEQWRQSQGTSSSGPEILRVLASTTSPIDGFTYFPALDFTAPIQTVAQLPVGGMDGNAAANRVFISNFINFAAPVPDGGTFYVRWHDWNDNGTSDHFLGIDDVTITLIPEPGTVSLALLGLGALIACRRMRK
jgi:hypothetical protein